MTPARTFLSKQNRAFLLSLFVPTSVRQQIFLGVTVISLLSLLMALFVPAILVFTLYLAGVYLLLQRLMERPIRSLLQLTRQGGFDLMGSRMDVASGDEFSRIARAVYGMANRMRESIVEARELTTRLDEIFSAIGEGVVIVDFEGKIVKINNTARRWVGWYGDAMGRRVSEVLRSVELTDRLTVMQKSGQTEPALIENLHLPGPEVKMVRAKIVAVQKDPDSTVFMVFLFDLTDLHKLQEIRREFFANVSHELKTPISAIRGYSETIRDMDVIVKNELAVNFLSVIVRNTEHLAQLIDDMLTLAGLESGSLTLDIRPYDVRAALGRVMETVAPKAREAQVETMTDVAPEVDVLYVDAQRFDSVLLNLVDNGVKYNRQGGYVKVSVRQNATHHLVFVEDTGIGISDVGKLRAFERFYRADKAHAGGGTGLGLAIVKHVVQSHGGKISLRSEEKIGTVFTVAMPRNPTHKKIELQTPL